MAKRKTYEIVRADQIEVLGSAVRLEILDAVRVLGPCPTSQVARFLGRKASALYYHLEKLLDVGLLLEAGSQQVGNRTEALYETPARQLRMPFRDNSPELTKLRLKTFTNLLRVAAKDHERAFERGVAVTEGKERNTFNARLKGWLTPSQRRHVLGLIEDLVEAIESNNPPQDARAQLHALTVFLTPFPGDSGQGEG